MGTEFSRRVNAGISVSGSVSASPATCADCSMWKIAERDWNGRTDGRTDAEEQGRRRAASRTTKIAIKICTTRHKKHGNRMQPAAATLAASLSGRDGDSTSSSSN